MDAVGQQQSAEWLASRCGKATASRFKDVMAKLKNGKPAAARETYLWEVVIERLTGKPAKHYTSDAMMWGTEQEGFSRMAYESAYCVIVEECGFIAHPEWKDVGGSPDGLIGTDGGWESKSPYNSAVHLQTILDGMPADHMAQVQGLMWITGRKWWDFASYDPRMPAPLDLYVQRIERDEAYITILKGEVAEFLSEVEAKIARLPALSAPAQAAL